MAGTCRKRHRLAGAEIRLPAHKWEENTSSTLTDTKTGVCRQPAYEPALQKPRIFPGGCGAFLFFITCRSALKRIPDYPLQILFLRKVAQIMEYCRISHKRRPDIYAVLFKNSPVDGDSP